jgi:hypothetical protein
MNEPDTGVNARPLRSFGFTIKTSGLKMKVALSIQKATPPGGSGKPNMNSLIVGIQILIAVSVWMVWVLRFDNIVKEFEHFGYPTWFRSLVGALKISLAALLIAGIWFPPLVFYSAVSMAILMVGAQLTHLRVKNPMTKFIPSFVLLTLSLVVAYSHLGQH